MKKQAGIVVWAVLAGMALCGVSGAEISYRFERMWPTLRQPWYFNSPYAVACDPLGAVYVADARNHRVQKFSSRGEFITAWGTEGTGAGQFDEPAGLAVDSNGHVLVADRGNSRVLRFTASGVFIAEWGGGVLAHPEGIAVDAFGTIYVADTLNHRIAVFDSNGTLVDSWGARGSGNRQFDRPDGIALDASGRIYVAEYGNHRVQVLAKDGSFVAVWGTEGSDNGQFLTPTDVAVDAQGYVYVTDEGQCRVQKFDTSGAFVTAWGRQGYGRGEFDIPDGIAVAPNGQIFMTDRGRHDYVHVFSPDGAHMATWGSQLTGPNEYNGPVALAKDTTGNIYVADIGNARIQRLDADGRFNAIWGPAPDEPGATAKPFDIAIASQGYVYVADRQDQRIRRYGMDGTFQIEFGGSGGGEGQFLASLYICVDPAGNVYASDELNHRIQKFTANGNYLGRFGLEGSGPGQFRYPRGLTFAGGHLYVADSGNHRIQKLTSNGVFVAQWGSEGNGPGQLSNPRTVEVGPGGEVFVADEGNNRIQRFTTDGTFVAEWGGFGHSPGLLSGPWDVLALDNDRVLVADYLNNRLQRFRAITQAANVKAVIVAGGGPFPGNQLWDTTELCANFAYRTLTYQGYDKSTIYYLSSDLGLDLDNNGVADDVNAAVTRDNLASAMTQWASDSDSLVVYLVDHGGVGTFRLSETETLAAADFVAMLANAQNVVNGPVTVVIDACHSGSFVELLAKNGPANRILVTSTPPEQPAYFLGLGSVSFSSFFWSEIFNGQSVGEAFRIASESLQPSVPLQVPMLDANADGQANGTADLSAANAVWLGGTDLSSDKPAIGQVSSGQIISGTASASFMVSDVTPEEDTAKVWAVIRAPFNPTQAQTSGKAVLDMPTTIMWPTETPGVYEGRYDGFTTPGTYQIAVYAQDRSLNVSTPKITSVSVDTPLRRRAIIVGGAERADAPADIIDQNTTLAYETLRFQGYTDDDIRFFSPRAVSTGVDAAPSLGGLESSLKTWAAQETQDLVLYMIGAGGAGRFELNSGETLLAASLNIWLDTLQATLPGPVVVIYDACASGSFLPFLAAGTQMARIVVSSTQADASAAFSIQSGLSFSQFFWRQILNGAHVRNAYQHAANAVRFGKNARKPQLDDNGDGVYDTRTDGALARTFNIGMGILLAGDEPMIGAICEEQVLGGGKMAKNGGQTSATIWVSDVSSTGVIESVWVIITPPGYIEYGCGAGNSPETILELDPMGGNRYEKVFDGFSERGAYQITAYAMDKEGNVSLPRESSVRQLGDYVEPDIYEPDDTFDTASWIGFGGTEQEHNFSKPGDEDWALFHVEAGNKVVIRTRQLAPGADTYIQLYRSDGTTLLEEDDNGGGDDNSSYLLWDVDITGFYLVRVTNMPDTAYGADTTYLLSVGDLSGNLLTGALSCVVSDSGTSLPIRNATLRLNFALLQQRTDFNGIAIFTSLPAGSYSITVEATGYLSKTQTATVTAGAVAPVSIALQPVTGEGEGEGEGEPPGCFGKGAAATLGGPPKPPGGGFMLAIAALGLACCASRRERRIKSAIPFDTP
ncbi:MAG TPA: SMP-30/gluconolactonase/LRE family protein [Candidatus Hydrogenedentes bacterium]|nr:SMP-30/gluconolactonase/LRE family protein [Candidatus Hydrogenedentota bacterium]